MCSDIRKILFVKVKQGKENKINWFDENKFFTKIKKKKTKQNKIIDNNKASLWHHMM